MNKLFQYSDLVFFIVLFSAICYLMHLNAIRVITAFIITILLRTAINVVVKFIYE
jgi:hypothetical protein